MRFLKLEGFGECQLANIKEGYPRLVFNCNVDITFLGKLGRLNGDEGRSFSMSKSLEVRRKMVLLFLEMD